MTTAELIEALKKAPPEMEVACYWDGAPRGGVDLIFLQDGFVVMAEERECYERPLPQDKIIHGEEDVSRLRKPLEEQP